MDWEVVSYGSGDFLRMVFTAIASIFGNDDYAAAMQTSAMLGFVGVLFKAAFDRDVMKNFRWFMGIITFIMLVIVPKSTVIVNDRINPSDSAVISNVPIGLAATDSFFSFTGDWLSRSFETVFSMPNEVRYTSSGFLFANSLYDASTKLTFPDDRTNNNFMEFFSSCVVVDGIGHKRFSWRDVMISPNLVNFFSENVAVNAASFKYTDPSGSDQILLCRSGFSDSLAPDMLALSGDVMKYGIQGGFISRFNGVSSAEDKLQNDIQGAMSFLTGVSLSPSSLVTQQAIINNMAQGTHRLSQETNAAEFNQYIVSGAELHRLTTYQALAAIASEKLPLLRSLFEAFIYAIFPIIVMMAIVFPSKVPFAYLTALVWINLWAPMYAILHFAMSYYSQATMTEIAALYGNGFSIFANSEMAKFNADVVSTTGYLTTALPVLAWMLVSRSGALAASFAGRIMQGYDQSVAQVASEGVKGAGQRLNEKWEVTSAGNIQNTSVMDSGSTVTQTGNRTSLLNQVSQRLLISPEIFTSSAQAKHHAIENAVSHEQSEGSQLASAKSAALTNANSSMTSLSKEHGSNQKFLESETASQQRNFAAVENSMDAWAQREGIELSDQTRATILGSFGASVGVAKGGMSAEGSTSESERESNEIAKQFMKSSQYTDAVSHIGQNTKEIAENFGSKESNTDQNQLTASLNQLETAKREYNEAVNNTKSARESLSNIEELRSVLKIDQGQALFNAAQKSGTNTEQFDTIIRAAASGDENAQQIVDKWVQSVPRSHIPVSNDDFKKTQDEIYGNALNGVNGHYDQNKNNIDQKNTDYLSQVENQKTVVVDSASTQASVNSAINDASNKLDIHKSNTYTDGNTTQTKVEIPINESKNAILPAPNAREALREKVNNLLK